MAYSVSEYSPGTSSSGTSCVCTSCPSASPALSTPATTPASNAFPSSSNSSTLSESAPSRFDKPCKSPDCPPDRAPNPLGSNTTVSTPSLLPRDLVFLSFFFFGAAFRAGAAFLAGGAFFAALFLGVDFRFGVFLGLVGFFFFLVLVAIAGVYH